jgi:hypothetical protein
MRVLCPRYPEPDVAMILTIDCPQLGEQEFVNVESFVVQDDSVELTFNRPNGTRSSTVEGTLVAGGSNS